MSNRQKVSFKAVKKVPKPVKVEFYAKKKNRQVKKIVYLDTCTILDYLLRRNDEAAVLLRSIKKENG